MDSLDGENHETVLERKTKNVSPNSSTCGWVNVIIWGSPNGLKAKIATL